MKEILDIVAGNTFIFVGVILFLVTTFLVLIRAIVKTFNDRKIPIYEEGIESTELESIKEKDIIEKPSKKKEETPIEDENEEKSILKENDKKETNVENEKEEEEIEIKKEELEVEEESKETLIEEIPDREELEQIEDKEIEARIDKEHKKDIKEAINNSSRDEFRDLLSDINDTKDVNPEEVVKNFEEEQEAHSIISYQELVDVVKNRENEFVDELETKPLATLSDFIDEKEKIIEPDIEVLEIIEQLENAKTIGEPKIEELMAISDDDIEQLEPSVEEIEVLEPIINEFQKESKMKEIILEPLPKIANDGRFKKTDVISPIFGKLEAKDEVDYPKVEKFKRDNEKKIDEKQLSKKIMQSVANKIELPKEEKNDSIEDIEKEAAEALKSFNSMFEDISEKIDKKEDIQNIDESFEEEIESLTPTNGISKNEDFLKALKDFRNSL